jgi:hypothetical protein
MTVNEEGDIEIGTINMAQTMSVMAAALRATVSTFIKPDDPDEDKAKLALICFSVFLHQYIMSAKKPELYAPILEIMTTELRNAQS